MFARLDQAFVEQRNDAVIRRLVRYGRFDRVEAARVCAALRLLTSFSQLSFALRDKRGESAKVGGWIRKEPIAMPLRSLRGLEITAGSTRNGRFVAASGP
jgi:hypothetical protein